MKIVILHNHLKTGGVTTVIKSQIQALARFAEYDVSVLSGEATASPDQFGGIVEVESVLNYMDPTRVYSKDDVNRLLNSTTAILKSHVSEDALLHVHNLSLGKNPVLALAVARLAADGMKVVNHCHDFAEDRPANLAFLRKIISETMREDLHGVIYHDLPNYFYAMLTSSDGFRLKNLGVPEERLCLLPNPAALPERLEDHAEAKSKFFELLGVSDTSRALIVYPVRAIQRKNIGEFILLAALFKNSAEFAITLPPANPLEKPLYEQWREFAYGLPCGNIHFAVGEKLPFQTIMSAADCCLTTSVREGFGMMYIEPWLFGKPIVGRDLSNVTVDFKCSGIEFPALYESLVITGDSGHCFADFAGLDVEAQKRFIAGVAERDELAARFLNDNPGLRNILHPVDATIIARNASVVKSVYSIEKYGDELNETYKKVF